MAKRDVLFGELRSLLQQTPSEEVWGEIVAVLDRWRVDDHFREVVMPYVTEYLTRWPEDVRRMAPAKWVKPLLKKTPQPAPLLPLVNGLDLTRSRIGPKTMQYLCEREEVAHIRHLDLTGNGVKSEGAKHLARSTVLTQLVTLIMTDTKVGNSGAVAMAGSDNFRNLQELDLSGSDMNSEGCGALERSTKLPEHLRAKAWDWFSDEREEREYYWNSWE